MPLHLGVSGHHGAPATKAGQTAIREARKKLLERVRDDWEYEPWPESRDQHDPNRNSYISSPLDWTERSFTGSEMDEDEHDGVGDDNNFKFESPDTVGAALERRRAIRKRKRQTIIEEEKSWNEGFAIFESRRDAWTGARSGAIDHSFASQPTLSSPSSSPVGSPTASSGSSRPHSSPLSDGAGSGSFSTFDPFDSRTLHLPSKPNPSGSTTQQTTLIPLVEPILPPTHPIRATINPASYPQIYTEVVINSRSPSVPINLADMTKACVQGWIEDGEWPPKPGALEPMIAKRRRHGADALGHGNLRRGVEGMKRILRISGGTSNGAEGEEGCL